MDNKTINHENDEMDHQVETGETSEKPLIDSEELRQRVMEEKERRKNQSQPKKKTAGSWHKKKKVTYVKPEKRNRVAIGMFFATLILAVSVVSAMGIIFLVREMIGIDKSSSSYILQIPEGATVSDIIEIMTTDQVKKGREEIIKVPAMFKLLAKMKKADGQFINGTHVLRPNMGYLAMIEELESDESTTRETVSIAFKEGINLYDAATLLEENSVCERDKFIYYFNNGLGYAFEDDIPKATALDLRFYRMEGYLFPDTYDFYQTDDIYSLEQEEYEIIVRKFYDNFELKYNADVSQRAAEQGLPMDEVITLASIVQAEAASEEDMYNVASVLRNRLNDPENFPRLESDTTEKYANNVIAVLSDTVNDTMMEAYNTYSSGGLPPGPICNPGEKAIDAVLNPNQTNYYYFCANIDTKEVYYAETYEQHRENLALAGIDESELY